jgi:hypothetical protein
MVLAVAALLFQFQTIAPPAPAVGAQMPATQVVSVNAFEESAPVSTQPAVVAENDYVAANTDSSSVQMNLAEVRLVSSDSRNEFAGGLKTVSFETSGDAQSFSTVRIPEVSTKGDKFREALSQPSRNQWLALALLEHAGAAFDAYSTRQAVGHGMMEDNPTLRPFAGSPAIYAATQVAPVLFDLMAYHMQRSEYPVFRRFWWMPQTLSAGLSIFSGVHNLHLIGKM